MHNPNSLFIDKNNNGVLDALETLHASARYVKKTLLPELRDTATVLTAVIVAFITLGEELRKMFDQLTV